MSIETEVKIRIANPEAVLDRLVASAPARTIPRHFEDNYVFDFPGEALRSSVCLLRVRITGERSTVTYKGPPREEGIFKVREELETMVADASVMISILERLGLRIDFRYQKYRREFIFNPSDSSGADLHIAYDETPIGCYLELEGSEQEIVQAAGKMGFPESDFVRHSYYSLYREYCETRGRKVEFMLFD